MEHLELFREHYKEILLPQLRVLDAQRKKLIMKGILGAMVWLIAGGIGIFLMLEYAPKDYLIGWIVLICLLCGVFAVYTYIQTVSNRSYYRKFKQMVIEGIIKFIGPNLKYFPHRKIPVKLFLESGIFTKKPYRYKGDDMVAGNLSEEVVIEGSELEVFYLNNDGSKKKLDTLFKGMFIVADLGHKVTCDALIVPKKHTLEEYHQAGAKDLKEVDLGDEEFSQYFNVFSFCPDSVKEMMNVNPELKNILIEYKKEHPRNDIFVSIRGSRIYYAVSYDKELFEPKLYSSLIDRKVIEEYFEDLDGATSMIKKIYMFVLKQELEKM